ncbi:MAG TPA: DUF4136 domain-containing protein [Candidatus Acidoferrales bacterium]|nr:DUF4136 domain-containing protein [Candidatus Acidoferrales bacterium]
MHQTLTLSFAGLILLAAPCLAGNNAKNDFDPGVDFSRYSTFSFIGGHELERTGILSNPETRERFKNFIGGALEMRGLSEVPRDQKYTLAVRYWVAFRQKQDVSVIDLGVSSWWGGYPPYWTGVWGYSYQEYVVDNYVQGTLIVDLIDPTSKDLVWRIFLRQKIEDRAKAYKEAKKNLYNAIAVWPPSESEKEKMRQERAKREAKYKREMQESAQ